jgi:hypothetical protein
MAYVVDFQAFKSPSNEYILKELAIVRVDTNIIQHCFIKPPVSSTALGWEQYRQNKYITKYIHNIPWNYGHVELRHALHILNDTLTNATVVYVKGLERAQYLKKILWWLVDIVDLNDMKCPLAEDLPSALLQLCPYDGHSSRVNRHYRCSLRNAQKYKQWLLKEKNI